MTATHGAREHAGFLDMQSAVGITKHIGGLDATRELAALCHVRDAHEVLDVGCGIGAGPAYLARTFGCRVVGADISERMIGWARQRARQARAGDLIGSGVADVLDLPFADDQFDVVICESVLDFVPDKAKAVRECVRVTKPGGYVGLNEGLWLHEPPPRLAEQVRDAIGPSVPAAEHWREIWDGSGLDDRVALIRHVRPRAEIMDRITWIGWRWILRAWGRAILLYARNPAMRNSIRRQLDVPSEVFNFAGYGLFIGRKPAADGPAGRGSPPRRPGG